VTTPPSRQLRLAPASQGDTHSMHEFPQAFFPRQFLADHGEMIVKIRGDSSGDRSKRGTGIYMTLDQLAIFCDGRICLFPQAGFAGNSLLSTVSRSTHNRKTSKI
jgi:hypothetical protein